MTDECPVLYMTYAELLKTTEGFLQHIRCLQQGNTPGPRDLELRRGVILYWYHLALQTGASIEQCQTDMTLLCRQAGLPDGSPGSSVEVG